MFTSWLLCWNNLSRSIGTVFVCVTCSFHLVRNSACLLIWVLLNYLCWSNSCLLTVMFILLRQYRCTAYPLVLCFCFSKNCTMCFCILSNFLLFSPLYVQVLYCWSASRASPSTWIQSFAHGCSTNHIREAAGNRYVIELLTAALADPQSEYLHSHIVFQTKHLHSCVLFH